MNLKWAHAVEVWESPRTPSETYILRQLPSRVTHISSPHRLKLENIVSLTPKFICSEFVVRDTIFSSFSRCGNEVRWALAAHRKARAFWLSTLQNDKQSLTFRFVVCTTWAWVAPCGTTTQLRNYSIEWGKRKRRKNAQKCNSLGAINHRREVERVQMSIMLVRVSRNHFKTRLIYALLQ